MLSLRSPTRSLLIAVAVIAFLEVRPSGVAADDRAPAEPFSSAVTTPSHNPTLFSYRRDDGAAAHDDEPTSSRSEATLDDSFRVASHSEVPQEEVALNETRDAFELNGIVADNNARRLSPPGPSRAIVKLSAEEGVGGEHTPFAFPKAESLTTATAGLAIVVGLFLLCMTLLRKAGPGPTTTLPREAVSVLGRIPLAARHFAYLIHLGNKLVLVSVSADQVQTITEVTDPPEVDRLLGLCLRGSKHSTTADFQRILDQLAKEPARGFLGKEAARSSTV